MNEKNLILYFTGTNNSKMVANRIAAKINKETSGTCGCIPFSRFNTMEKIEADSLGIVCPVYFYGLPNLVRNVLEKIDIKPGTYIYSVVTMGSSAGNTLPEIDMILRKSQNRLSYGAAVKCPDNYSTALGFQKIEKHEMLLNEAENVIEQAAIDICQKKENSIPKYHKLTELFMGGYRRSLSKKDKKFYADDTCNGCGLCAKNCPVQNIQMEKGKPVWQHQCEFCLACLSFCQKSAVQMGKKTKGKPRYQNPFQ